MSIPVLVINYLPVKGDRIDRSVTGDRGEPLDETGTKCTPPERWDTLLFWSKFVGSDRTYRIVHPGCGWALYPPNAEQDHDRANKRFVESDIEDWKPDGTVSAPASGRWRSDRDRAGC
jgi:hypothetical protein